MTIWCIFYKFRTPSFDLNRLRHPMSLKRQKLSSNKSRRVEGQTEDFDSTKFVNVGAIEKFTLISKNRSFIKEKGFHHPDHFSRKTITNKGVEGALPTPKADYHNGGARILRQPSSSCGEKGPSTRGIGRF